MLRHHLLRGRPWTWLWCTAIWPSWTSYHRYCTYLELSTSSMFLQVLLIPLWYVIVISFLLSNRYCVGGILESTDLFICIHLIHSSVIMRFKRSSLLHILRLLSPLLFLFFILILYFQYFAHSVVCVVRPHTLFLLSLYLFYHTVAIFPSRTHTHTHTCTNNLFPLPLYTPFPFYTPIPHPHTLHSFSNSYLSIPWRIREWPKLLRKRSSPVWKWVHQLAALVLPTNLLGNPYRYLLSVRLIFIFNMTDFTSSCRNILIEVTKL